MVFTALYNPWSARIRPQYKEIWKRFYKWLRLRRKKIALILLLIAAVPGILYIVFFVNNLAGGKDQVVTSVHESENEAELKPEPKLEIKKGIVADHSIANMVRLNQIPESPIQRAKAKLHIVYAHASHGSQLVYGMKGLISFRGALYDDLDLYDHFVEEDEDYPDISTWAARAKTYLDDPSNQDINVVMWSWANKLSSATEADVTSYLDYMSSLEKDYPEVQFVYMTGHVDGSGLTGNVHLRNEPIRE